MAPGTQATLASRTGLSYLTHMTGNILWPGDRRQYTTSLAHPGCVGPQMARKACVSRRAKSRSAASASSTPCSPMAPTVAPATPNVA